MRGAGLPPTIRNSPPERRRGGGGLVVDRVASGRAVCGRDPPTSEVHSNGVHNLLEPAIWDFRYFRSSARERSLAGMFLDAGAATVVRSAADRSGRSRLRARPGRDARGGLARAAVENHLGDGALLERLAPF